MKQRDKVLVAVVDNCNFRNSEIWIKPVRAMEKFDELEQKPDDNGVLDLSHRAWVVLDDCVWDMSKQLVFFDVSHNHIKQLPPAFGRLLLLREFDCSHNKITDIPREIGLLVHLKLLRISHNYIDVIPESLVDCKSLDIFDAANNQIERIPRGIGNLKCLTELHLQNNRLLELPAELGNLIGLTQLVNVDGNSELSMVPEHLRKDTGVILWLCKQLQDHSTEVRALRAANRELEALARATDGEKLRLKSELVKVERSNRELLDSLPKTYMRTKAVVSKMCVVM